jgi:hypothetical protein
VEVPKERGSAKAESKSEAQAKMKGSKTLETGETLGWGMRNGRFILSCEVPSSVDGTGHAWLFPIAIMTANLWNTSPTGEAVFSLSNPKQIERSEAGGLEACPHERKERNGWCSAGPLGDTAVEPVLLSKQRTPHVGSNVNTSERER